MLNKIDLVSEEELDEVESKIKSINRFAPMYHTENSIIDPANLINIGSFDLERTLEMDPEFLDTESEHEHDDRVTSTSSKFEGALNVNKLERWIGELMQTKGEDLFRYKGVLAVKGMDQKFVFQGVHMLFGGGFSSEVAPWKEGETRDKRGKQKKGRSGKDKKEEGIRRDTGVRLGAVSVAKSFGSGPGCVATCCCCLLAELCESARS